MQARVLWPAIGRCALVAASLSSLTFLGGCSSGVSRFDFPSFGLARSSEPEPLADPNATASLPPVPQESIYAQGGQGNYQSPVSERVVFAFHPAAAERLSERTLRAVEHAAGPAGL